MLAAQPGDVAIGVRVLAMGCECDPTRDGSAWRDWPHQMARRVAGAPA